MPNLIKKAPDTNNIDDGFLRISIAGRSNGLPIRNARISISYSSEPDRVIEEVRTDESGNSEEILLSALLNQHVLDIQQPFQQQFH